MRCPRFALRPLVGEATDCLAPGTSGLSRQPRPMFRARTVTGLAATDHHLGLRQPLRR